MSSREFKLVNIGYGNFVVLGKIVSVVAPYSAPIQRFLKYMKAEHADRVIDGTYGNKLRSVIQTDCGMVYLSPVRPSTIAIKLIELYNDEGVEKIEIEEGEEVAIDVSEGEEEKPSV